MLLRRALALALGLLLAAAVWRLGAPGGADAAPPLQTGAEAKKVPERPHYSFAPLTNRGGTGAFAPERQAALVKKLGPRKGLVCVRGSNPRRMSLFAVGLLRTARHRFTARASCRGIRRDATVDLVSVGVGEQQRLAGLRRAKALRRGPTEGLLVVAGGDEQCAVTDLGMFDARQYFSAALPAELPYLPLGPRYEFAPLPAPGSWRPPQSRGLLFNAMFALSTAPAARGRLGRLLADPRWMAAFKGHGTKVRVIRDWDENPGAGDNSYVAPSQYREALLDSVFTLCPGGNNPETYRQWEAIEAGSIPVLALDGYYRGHACKDAYRPLIDSKCPALFINDWGELPAALAPYMADPLLAARRQELLRAWREEFWAAQAGKVGALLESAGVRPDEVDGPGDGSAAFINGKWVQGGPPQVAAVWGGAGQWRPAPGQR